MYVSARKTNAYFKNILRSKSLSWPLMPLQVRIQEHFRRLVDFESQMLYTKIQPQRHLGSTEEDFYVNHIWS